MLLIYSVIVSMQIDHVTSSMESIIRYPV